MSSQLVVNRLASRQASLMYASGAQVNLFENESHAILNPYNHDIKEMSIQGQTPTAFNQSVIRWEVPKFEDCFKSGFISLTTNAVGAPGGDAFVDHYGYVAFRRMYIQLTNNPYTAEFEVPYFMFDRHRVKYNSRQYLQYLNTGGYLIGTPLAQRQAVYAAGHTALIDLEVGQAFEGFENMFWVSPLAHNLMIYAQLANIGDVLDTSGSAIPGTADTAAGTLSTLISDCRLYLTMNTVDDDARANSIATYNSDDGIYNFVREPRIWSFNVAAGAATGGLVSLDMEETRPFTMMTIFYECEDKVTTAYRRVPFDIQGPTMTDNAANTVNFFTDFELLSLGGETIVKKRSVAHQRAMEHKWRFADRESNDWIINCSLAAFDPLKCNTINGALDPNVYNKIRLNLYFTGAVATGGSGARVTVLFHAFNFVHNSHADANKVIA